MGNTQSEEKDAFLFTSEKKPLQISIKFYRDKNGAPKFWMKHPTEPNFCGDLINDNSVLALYVGNDKKLYIIDTSINVIRNKGIKFLKK